MVRLGRRGVDWGEVWVVVAAGLLLAGLVVVMMALVVVGAAVLGALP